MVLKIRLARFGKTHKPLYNIVVAQARTARDSLPLEVLGTYNPIPIPPKHGDLVGSKPHKDIQLDIPRARYWLGVGAQPSKPMERLLSMVGLMEPRFYVQKMQQAGLEVEKKARRQEKRKEKETA